MYNDEPYPALTGEEFRRLREFFGMSQEEAAAFLNMKNKSQISRMERKRNVLVPANIVNNLIATIAESGGPAHNARDAINRIREAMDYEAQLNIENQKRKIDMDEDNENFTKHLNTEIRKAETRNEQLESRNYNLSQELQDERIKNSQIVREVDHMKFMFETFKSDINTKVADIIYDVERLIDSKIQSSQADMKNILHSMIKREFEEHEVSIQKELDRIADEAGEANEKKGLSGILTDTPGLTELLQSLGTNLGPAIAPEIASGLKKVMNGIKSHGMPEPTQQPPPVDPAIINSMQNDADMDSPVAESFADIADDYDEEVPKVDIFEKIKKK